MDTNSGSSVSSGAELRQKPIYVGGDCYEQGEDDQYILFRKMLLSHLFCQHLSTAMHPYIVKFPDCSLRTVLPARRSIEKRLLKYMVGTRKHRGTVGTFP